MSARLLRRGQGTGRTAQEGGDVKDIEIYSYIRDKRGRIRYKGEKAMTRPHLWQFDPQTQRYEGQAE